MSAENSLSARDIELAYPNGVRALNGISLEVPRGEFLAIIGPNGSGKSSLLRVLAGLQPPTTGEVRIEGTQIKSLAIDERARRLAMVSQNVETLSAYSVENFVLLGRYAHLKGWRLFSKHDRDVAVDCLRRVDAGQFLDRSMREMSGGERQRVLLARALAQEARIILLDEPTSALDVSHQLMVYRLIFELHKNHGKTVVVVTHDLNLASQFAQRLILMQSGRIAAQGSPSEVLREDVLRSIYGGELAYGEFSNSVAGEARPWVLPWARR